jgi:hypothetical protein
MNKFKAFGKKERAFEAKLIGGVKTKAASLYKKAMTPRDATQGGKYKIDRVGTQLIRTKVK